jgi:RNA polymerase sigma-70 factor (ECF subfamily)
MRSQWEALHESLAQSVRTRKAGQQFNEVRRQRRVLARFEKPVSLLKYLTQKGGDLDEKDAIYAALVKAIQSREREGPLALQLLWLGLWPALDALYRRRIRWFAQAPQELVSEIIDCLNEVIAGMDFSRVRRVAATLARSTERKVVERLHALWNESARRGRFPEEATLGAVEPIEPEEKQPSPFGVEEGASDEEELAALQEWLAGEVGEDASLVMGAVIYGESQRALAERLGLRHDAARKRFQRALARLRKRLTEKAGGLSQSEG